MIGLCTNRNAMVGADDDRERERDQGDAERHPQRVASMPGASATKVVAIWLGAGNR